MTDLSASARAVGLRKLQIVPIEGEFYAFVGHTLIGIYGSHSRALEALLRWA